MNNLLLAEIDFTFFSIFICGLACGVWTGGYHRAGHGLTLRNCATERKV